MKERFSKDRFEALMRMADFLHKRAEFRRHFEWRTSVSLWAVLSAVTYYVQKRPPNLILASTLAISTVAYIYFCLEVRVRSRADIERAFFFFDAAKRMLASGAAPPPAEPKAAHERSFKERFRDFHKDIWSTGIQILTTIILALLAYFLIGRGFMRAGGSN